MLSCTDIQKSFNNNTLHILRGVSCNVPPGQITCLIGPSGSGKTTLLRSLGLLEYPDQGRIQIDDKVHEFPRAANAATPSPWPELTVVFQSLFLWPHLSLFENIALPARNVIKNEGELADRINDLAVAFDMTEYLHRFPNEASLGQRQRVALARALILKPKYVLLDEITSALDVEQIEKILHHLIILKSQGVGVFLITHLLGFARRAADQILFMDCGQITERGGPNILQAPQTDRFRAFLRTVEAAS